MSNPFDFSDSSFYGIPISEEKTPVISEEKPEIITGIRYDCYICGASIRGMNHEQYHTIMYTKQESKCRIEPYKYILTYCEWCFKDYIKKQ